MKSIVFQFVIFGLITIAFADDLPNFSITTNQAAEIRQRLDAYENGKLTLQDLNDNAGVEGARRLIGYYFLQTNAVSTKAKLPIGRSFMMIGMNPHALPLAKEYVNTYSNDWRGWRFLGGCSYSLNLSNEAVYAYSNAVRYGDTDSYETLAALAFKNGQLDVVKSLVPQLQDLKNSAQTPWEAKIHLMNILICYAAKTDQKEIFINALKGMKMDEILKDPDAKLNIATSCKIFTGQDIDEIRQEMEEALGSTNNVSSPPR